MSKITKSDYYTCSRCENNTLKKKGTMIPCPRGGCEAIIAGTIIKETKITIDTNLSKDQKDWNTNR